MADRNFTPPQIGNLTLSECDRIEEHLRARYPEFSVMVDPNRYGGQVTRYHGSLDRMVATGLVTDRMLKVARGKRDTRVTTPIGDGFVLREGADGVAVLWIYTDSCPRGLQYSIAVNEARGALKRFMLPKSPRRAPRL